MQPMRYVALRGQNASERSCRWVQFRSNKQTWNLHAMRSEFLRDLRLEAVIRREQRRDPGKRSLCRHFGTEHDLDCHGLEISRRRTGSDLRAQLLITCMQLAISKASYFSGC